MSRKIFNARQMERLEQNPNVVKVSERSITYSPAFKIQAVKENLAGKGPQQIFIEHGFDLSLLGRSYPKDTVKRWRKLYEKYGEEIFFKERRGKGSTGRPSTKELTPEQKLKKAEARIAYLEAENEFLKKLDELERQAMKKKR